jgi:tetratricopeptide (TPR) repeat protein
MPERNPAPPASHVPDSGARRTGSPAGWTVAAIFCATFIAYFPALNGGFIWDDHGHVTRLALRSWQGLWRIWFDIGATQQYYPLLHSAFWVEHRLWGDATVGYHLTTLALHACAACLFAVILRRLAIPGAFLAAMIFALHPVQVESVAWITEQKNTLSTVFYLCAALAYLCFDADRKPSFYLLALALFVLGLLTKTVTATLPAALLVIFWWQRGRLSWKRDILPLAPWFAIGAVAGLFTAWVERKLIGAEGAAFDFTLIQRCLLAGRVIWFYLGKLFWPAHLTFIYPRWDINPSEAWLWLPLAGGLALGVLLWLGRNRSRAPLAAFLFFVGSLFPVMGFFNVFPFMYSFVADHFQYLPSLGIITLVSAGLVRAGEQISAPPRKLGGALAALLLVALGALTWRQAHDYRDFQTIFRATIRRNPGCWMAYNNLGSDLLDHTPNLQEAIADFEQALQLKPDYAEAHYNLGKALARSGRLPEAIDQYEQALRLRPDQADTYDNLGNALYQQGQVAEAIEQYQQALRIEPRHADAHNNLGVALAQAGHLPEAIEQYQDALRLSPENAAELHNKLGNALARMGRLPDAMEEYLQALQIKPGDAGMHNNLGIVLAETGRLPEAMEQYQQALRLQPDYPEVHLNLANAKLRANQAVEAIKQYKEALRLKPDYAEAYFNLGIALIQTGQAAEAITQFEQVVRINPNDTQARNILTRLQAYQQTARPEK